MTSSCYRTDCCEPERRIGARRLRPLGLAVRAGSATDREQRSAAFGAVARPARPAVGEGDRLGVRDDDLLAAYAATPRFGVPSLRAWINHDEKHMRARPRSSRRLAKTRLGGLDTLERTPSVAHPSLSVQSKGISPEWGSIRYLSGLAWSYG